MNKYDHYGIDPRIYEGVKIGLRAMKTKEALKHSKSSKTVCFDIQRAGQSIFVLPYKLEDFQIYKAQVVLNGQPVASNSYSISEQTLNWKSDRRLKRTDSVAIKYPVVDSAKLVDIHKKKLSGTLGTYIKTDKCPCKSCKAESSLTSAYSALTEATGKLTQVVDNLSVATAVDKGTVTSGDGGDGGGVGGNGGAVIVTSITTPVDHVVGIPWHPLYDDEDVCLPVRDKEPKEPEEPKEEEMAMTFEKEPGAKVWHRLTGDGPWIIIQAAVLTIKSSQKAGGDEARVNSTFVETAWTVQTADGIKDFPDVVLTTKSPKKDVAPYWTPLRKTIAGIGAGLLAFGIVNAQWIAQLLNIWP